MEKNEPIEESVAPLILEPGLDQVQEISYLEGIVLSFLEVGDVLTQEFDPPVIFKENTSSDNRDSQEVNLKTTIEIGGF